MDAHIQYGMGTRSPGKGGWLALAAALGLLCSQSDNPAVAGWNPGDQILDFGVSVSGGERHFIVEQETAGATVKADLLWQVDPRTCRLQALTDSNRDGTAEWIDVRDDQSFRGRPAHASVSSVKALAVVAEQGKTCTVGSRPGEFIALTSTPHPTGGGVAAGESRFGAVVLVFRATAFYTPREVRVKVGERVVWLYADGSREPHTVSSGTCRGTDCPGSGALFASGPTLLRPGDRFDHTFTRPGSYPYHCDFHTATMQGTVIVQP
jgi:plastocyanin